MHSRAESGQSLGDRPDLGHANDNRERNTALERINVAGFERRHELIVVLDAGDCASDAFGFQGGLNQRGIVGVILQVQDVERGFHA